MKVPCPICHKEIEWKESPFRPFCSDRCKLIDLGRWASESYRVPVSSEEDDDEAPSESDREEGKLRGSEDGDPGPRRNGKGDAY